MNVVIATFEPYLRSTIAPWFELAPYFLILNTSVDRIVVIPHPVQLQAECSPASLLEYLRRFPPKMIIAGSFSADACRASRSLPTLLKQAEGRACDVLDCCLNWAMRKLGAPFSLPAY